MSGLVNDGGETVIIKSLQSNLNPRLLKLDQTFTWLSSPKSNNMKKNLCNVVHMQNHLLGWQLKKKKNNKKKMTGLLR